MRRGCGWTAPLRVEAEMLAKASRVMTWSLQLVETVMQGGERRWWPGRLRDAEVKRRVLFVFNEGDRARWIQKQHWGTGGVWPCPLSGLGEGGEAGKLGVGHAVVVMARVPAEEGTGLGPIQSYELMPVPGQK